MSLRKSRNAFGLAELLVSIGVVVPVVMVAVGIFPFSMLANQQAWSLSFAHDVARSRLEAVRATDFDHLPTTTQKSTVRDPRNNDYQCELTVTPQASAQNLVMLVRVDVVVTWSDKKPERLALSTSIARTVPAK